VLLGLRLLHGVAALVMVGGAVDADADLLAVALHPRARGADAFGLVQVVGQLLVGPVSAVEALLARALDDPAFDLVGQSGRDLSRRARGLAWAQAIEPALQVGVEPALDGARGDGQVRGYLLVGPVPAGQPHYLDAISVLRVGFLAIGQFEALRLPLGQSDAYHFLSSLSFFPPSLYASDNLTGRLYQATYRTPKPQLPGAAVPPLRSPRWPLRGCLSHLARPGRPSLGPPRRSRRHLL